MKLLLPKIVGTKLYQFEVEADNFHALIMESQKLSFNDVSACGKCGSNLLSLRAYITEKDKYEYVKIQCNKCKASATFGQSKKDKGVYYLRKDTAGKVEWQEFKDEGKPVEKGGETW